MPHKQDGRSIFAAAVFSFRDGGFRRQAGGYCPTASMYSSYT